MVDRAEGPSGERILLLTNRGPYEHRFDPDGGIEAVPGQGGVATALRLAAEYRPTTWLSSPLTEVDRLLAGGEIPTPRGGPRHRFVTADATAYRLFYETFCNEVLWFLQHEMAWPDRPTAASRLHAWDRGYLRLNQAFAEAAVDEADAGGLGAVMVHDYHFYLAPLFIRNLRPELYLQHFVHIPWPPAEEWERLEREIVASICAGLLANDSVFFQTRESAGNFLETCATYLGEAQIDFAASTVRRGAHRTRVLANPISVDPEELAAISASAGFRGHQRRVDRDASEQLIVRVDRLDPSKNVVAGFKAFRRLLADHPELRGKTRFLAYLVPSRSDVAAYRDYQARTFAAAEEINASFGRAGWQPVTIHFANDRVQALAALSLADVVLVNPLADGMNLVAKEAVLVNERDAALVLSRRAGAYVELEDAALGVDPSDVSATVAALHRALHLGASERRDRARRLRTRVITHDLRTWFAALLRDIEGSARLPETAPTPLMPARVPPWPAAVARIA